MAAQVPKMNPAHYQNINELSYKKQAPAQGVLASEFTQKQGPGIFNTLDNQTPPFNGYKSFSITTDAIANTTPV